MRKFLAALIAAFSLTAGAAQAGPILAGDSNSSTFSNLTCTSCVGTTLSSKTLTLGATARGAQTSLLNIINTSFSASGNVTGLKLAELQLNVGNKAGSGQTGVSFDYSIVLSFSTPIGSTSQIFDFNAAGNGLTGSNAQVAISGFSPLTLPDPLVMPNVTLSNFRFATDPLDSASAFSNGIWTASGPLPQTRSLFLLADVKDTTPPVLTAVTPVPEPFTLGVFGAGLLGMGALRRRRQAA